MRLAAIVLALAAAASAQVTTEVTAPLLGWLPEGTGIRPIHGLPAAAVLGPAVNVGHRLAKIAVSPDQSYVLASDAVTGEVLVIVPGVSATEIDSPVRPNLIVTSPQGGSAILWFSGAAQLEIVSGLPGAPAVRQIDASFLNAPPGAIAVSDDGQWAAAALSSGVYEWGPDGAVQQVYGGQDAGALAFFAGNADLAVATSTQLLSISASATSVLYRGSFSPAGVAASFDNQKIVLADRSGWIYWVDAATLTGSAVDCQCTPGGVFGLGAEVFRLTSSPSGPVKLFDASSGAVLAVPRASLRIPRLVHPAQAGEGLPAFTMNLTPAPTGFLQQPAVTITIPAATAGEIDGNVTLTFASSVGGSGDGSIQFSNASTTANFTIPAGSAQANFSGQSSITFSTGSVAGVITLTANVTAPTQVSSVATQTITTQPGVPVMTGVQLQQTPGGVTVVITGYSSNLEMSSGTFNFSLSSNATLTDNDLTVSVSPQFQTWYSGSSSTATGSQFTLSVPFAIVGNPEDLTGVTVTLLNSKGQSAAMSSK